MPNIIVEGPDGSGKTTLLDNLRAKVSRRYFVLVRHSCRPYSLADAMRFYDMLMHTNEKLVVVVDRHPVISEPIYGPILRKQDILEKYGKLELLEMIEKSSQKIIYCRPSEKKIKECLSTQPQLAGVAEKIELLIDNYDRCMAAIRKQTAVPVFDYDWEKTPFEDLEKFIFDEVSKKK